MRLPADLMAELTDYLEGILKNCELAAGIMSKMDLLVEASFGGRDAATVSKLITELAEREDATKAIQIDLTRRFLAAGDHLPPVETMLWLDVAFILSLVMVWKGLKNLKLDLNLGQALLVSAGVGLVVALLSLRWIKSLKAKHELERIEKKIELTDDEPEGIPFVRKKFRDQSRMGLPVSTTHTLVGAVLGIGLARGVEYLNLRMARDIFISWVVTIPAGAVLAIVFFYILKLFFMPGA